MPASGERPVPDREKPPKRRFSFGLRFSLVVYSLLTVLLTAVAVDVPWQYISRQNVSDLAGQINAEILNGLSNEVDGVFRTTVAAQQTIRDALEAGIVDVEDAHKREPFFFAFLQANPQFSWVSFGKPNGDLYGIQRRDAKVMRAETSRWDPSTRKATRTIDYYVTTGGLPHYFETKIETNDYFAPDRDWYKQAAAADGPIWTDLYLFATSGLPGLNTAVAVRRDGKVIGCLTIAIALERITDYLNGIKISGHGAAFIVDRQGRLIAFRDLAAGQGAAPVDEPYLKPIGEMNSPLIAPALAAMSAGGLRFDGIDKRQQMSLDDRRLGGRYFYSVAPLGRQGWVVGTVLPESDFTQQIDANRDKLLVAVFIALCLVSLIAVVTSRILFVRPLRAIALQTADIANFDLSRIVPVRSRIREIDWLSAGIVQMSRGLASFQKYLPIDLVRLLLARGMVAELGGEKRTLTIMFIDLAGFTRQSERLGHRLVPQLGEFLDAMSREIASAGGTIDKYIGDNVMAFWGAPDFTDNHAADACRGALLCVRRLESIRTEWLKRGMPDFRAHIGLNTGRVVVGNIGSGDRLNYTAIGDPVNLASRLEGLNRTYGTDAIVGQSTFEHVRYEFIFRRLDTVTVRGRDEPVKIYELLAEATEPAADEERFAWVGVFEEGLALYERQDWAAAIVRFRRAIELRGADPPSVLFIERCERLSSAEPVRAVGGAKNVAAE